MAVAVAVTLPTMVFSMASAIVFILIALPTVLAEVLAFVFMILEVTISMTAPGSLPFNNDRLPNIFATLNITLRRIVVLRTTVVIFEELRAVQRSPAIQVVLIANPMLMLLM